MAAGGLQCPPCDAVSLHPAGGEVRLLNGCDGAIGTLSYKTWTTSPVIGPTKTYGPPHLQAACAR